MTDARALRLEPVEIQHMQIRRGLLGYRRRDVDDLLEIVTASYEDVWYEREALQAQIAQLQSELERRSERDRLVGDVVRAAQRTAEETVAEARDTAEQVLAKARRRANGLVNGAQREPERLRDEIRGLTSFESAFHERFRAFFAVARQMLEEEDAGNGGDPLAPEVPRRSA